MRHAPRKQRFAVTIAGAGMSRRVALVTGASRGIGKATALALAEAGLDIATAARTVREGEGRDEIEPDRALVGSLDSTADAIRATGRDVLPVPMDLLNRASWSAAVEQVLGEWGQIDVLVNNARHQRFDHKARFIDVSLETLEVELNANLLAPAFLSKLVLPGMVERRSGIIINLTSTAGYRDPDAPAEKGGWSTSYALAKGGLQRLAPMIAMELGDKGIRAFNLNPGFVVTEKNASRILALGMGIHVGAPPSVPGAVAAWLASDPEAVALNGRTINAQPFALEHGLHPEWRQNSTPTPVGSEASVL
jgi:NAD(P)-dependent dehydrogenase (short-subunit alcohol dehydrogenase family)